jgi:hypothetical protein
VFVYTGFEGVVTWQYAMWLASLAVDASLGLGLCDLGPAPQAHPEFKWFGLFTPIIYHPELTDEGYVSAIKIELDCAFDRGYRVVPGRFGQSRRTGSLTP